MKTIVKDHNKVNLVKKITRMVEDGWVKKSDIIQTDEGLHYGSYTHLCVMEMDDTDYVKKKKKFNLYI